MYFCGENQVCCKGLTVFGPKPWAVVSTLLLINVPGIVFGIWTAEFYWKRNHYWKAAVCVFGFVQLVATYFLLRAAGTDPGIIPGRSWKVATRRGIADKYTVEAATEHDRVLQPSVESPLTHALQVQVLPDVSHFSTFPLQSL